MDHCLQAFDAAGTGVLVNDRLLNAPPQLSPPLLQFVMQDIQDCAEDGERRSFATVHVARRGHHAVAECHMRVRSCRVRTCR